MTTQPLKPRITDLSEELKKEIISKFVAGAKISQIIIEYGISRKTANKVIGKYGGLPTSIRSPKKRTALSLAEENLIIEMYVQGVKVKDITTRFSITTATLYRTLNVRGIPKNKPNYGAPPKGYQNLDKY